MPQIYPVGNIYCPSVGVKDIAVATLLGLVNLWVWVSNDSRWVHSNFVIHVPPETNTHFVTIFLTPRGEVLIAVSPSINKSAHFVKMHDDLVAQLRTTYNEIFRPYIYL